MRPLAGEIYSSGTQHLLHQNVRNNDPKNTIDDWQSVVPYKDSLSLWHVGKSGRKSFAGSKTNASVTPAPIIGHAVKGGRKGNKVRSINRGRTRTDVRGARTCLTSIWVRGITR